jgi:hypothetical protein
MSNRHSWKLEFMGRGSTRWHCVKCGIIKLSEYDCKLLYFEARPPRGRTWTQYAPPCPPPEADHTANKSTDFVRMLQPGLSE